MVITAETRGDTNSLSELAKAALVNPSNISTTEEWALKLPLTLSSTSQSQKNHSYSTENSLPIIYNSNKPKIQRKYIISISSIYPSYVYSNQSNNVQSNDIKF